MNENVQISEQSNVEMFKNMYSKLLEDCIKIRKQAGITQEFMADWLEVDRRKIIDLEKGKIKVGILFNYADKLSVKINLNYKII